MKKGLAVHTTSIHLHDHVKELEIIVKFYPVVDTVEATNMSWCHNLELYIDYGPDLIAPSRGLFWIIKIEKFLSK